jgi:electron transport complex protein RnfG
MSAELRQSIQKHSGILGAFALIVALALGLVNAATRDRITEQQQMAEREALQAVFPELLHDNDLLDNAFSIDPADSVFTGVEKLGLQNTRSAYRGLNDGQVTGVILPLTVPDGYSGAINLLVGISREAQITGVRVVSHRETPGLGDKIDLRISPWILDFDGKSLENPAESRWQVRKDGGDFDQFVGATITPRAVVGGVSRALEFFRDNREALIEP